MTQRFDNLATKWLKLIPMSSPPKNGLFLLTNGQFGFAINGVTTFVGAGAPTPITADGAVAPHAAGNYIITKASAAILTLAAPTAGTDDGLTISIKSATAFAHTLTATGLLETGTVKTDVATFAAFAGAGLTLQAYNGKWIVLSSVGITFT